MVATSAIRTTSIGVRRNWESLPRAVKSEPRRAVRRYHRCGPGRRAPRVLRAGNRFASRARHPSESVSCGSRVVRRGQPMLAGGRQAGGKGFSHLLEGRCVRRRPSQDAPALVPTFLIFVVVVPTMPFAMALAPLTFPPASFAPLLLPPSTSLPVIVVIPIAGCNRNRPRFDDYRSRLIVDRWRNDHSWPGDADTNAYINARLGNVGSESHNSGQKPQCCDLPHRLLLVLLQIL